MKKHINVPVFIPHLGCPNDCVFCNQRTISGHGDYDFAAVKGELDRAFATADAHIPTQIAYFGGSFTGIGRPEMVRLLALANEYIDAGKCESIRISTRPDYIDEEILNLLKRYRVRTVELGIQSMDDGRGNYSLGIKEQLIFPEIEYDKVEKIRGMDIAFVTTASTDEEAKELLELMGAPFAK